MEEINKNYVTQVYAIQNKLAKKEITRKKANQMLAKFNLMI